MAENDLAVAEQFSFDQHSGLAKDQASRQFATQRVTDALELTKRELDGIVDGQHGQCKVEIKGIGGSYAHGRPRVGLFPQTMSYEDARGLERQKTHGPGGVLAHDSGAQYPSDVDLEIVFKPADGRETTTIGDEVVMSRRVHEALARVFDQTRVFISPADKSPMDTKPVAEVLERLKTL
jgi:hypothetical protein